MKRIDPHDLLETVERLRQELHPELDAALLSAIVKNAAEHFDNEESARQGLERIIRAASPSVGGR